VLPINTLPITVTIHRSDCCFRFRREDSGKRKCALNQRWSNRNRVKISPKLNQIETKAINYREQAVLSTHCKNVCRLGEEQAAERALLRQIALQLKGERQQQQKLQQKQQ